MNHTLVTGGAGFIGSHVVEELVRRKEKVVILDNLSSGYLKNIEPFRDKIKFIKGDVTNKKDVEKAIKGVDFVLHLAASLSVVESVEKPKKYFKNNIVGTNNILLVSVKHKVKKVVFSSSCSVYGTADEFPTPETYQGVKLSPYAITKYTGEDLCRYYSAVFGMKSVILRYFNVYGVRQDASSSYAGVIPIFSKLMSQNKQPIIFGDGKQTRDFVSVKDVALTNINACKFNQSDNQTINIGSGEEISVNDLYKKIAKLLNFKLLPNYQKARSGEAARALGELSKMKKILKIKPKTIDQELENTVKYYQAY